MSTVCINWASTGWNTQGPNRCANNLSMKFCSLIVNLMYIDLLLFVISCIRYTISTLILRFTTDWKQISIKSEINQKQIKTKWKTDQSQVNSFHWVTHWLSSATTLCSMFTSNVCGHIEVVSLDYLLKGLAKLTPIP